ncbi:hypothetical protein AB0G77_15195 [Streptomyces hygroscopicus]|uniref:hypothetical protein n=1 Tax=Streptomyces hygroscopicus TaxID=1912 RepID=UPI003411E41A
MDEISPDMLSVPVLSKVSARHGQRREWKTDAVPRYGFLPGLNRGEAMGSADSRRAASIIAEALSRQQPCPVSQFPS